MQIYFDDQDVLHVCPENSTEVMALKYWKNEFEEHGEKVLEIETVPAIKL